MKPKLIAPRLKADFAKHETHFSFGIREADLIREGVDTIVITSYFTGFERTYTVFPADGEYIAPHEVLLSDHKSNVDCAEAYRRYVTKIAYGCTFEMSKVEVFFVHRDGGKSGKTVFAIDEVVLPLKESA